MVLEPGPHQGRVARNSDVVLHVSDQPPAATGICVAACCDMHNAIAFVAVALLGALLGSVWLRREDLEFNGESRTMVLGVVVALVSVLLILMAAG